MAGSEWVSDVTEADFQAAVVDASRERPVVVDFWAPWCGPCRQLGPLLEALAAEKAGAFQLAKVNTDENPNLAGEFGVEGIPAVYAVKDGRVVDQFTGLIPEPQLREFLGRLAPSEADARLAAARKLEPTDPAAAEAAYREAFAADAANEAARVGLARVLLAGRGREAEAVELLAPVAYGDHAEEAGRMRLVAELRDGPHADADLTAARSAADAAPDAAEPRLALGTVLAARGEYRAAMDELIAAAERDKKLGGGPVRELMVKIFKVIGNRSDEADEYRDRLRKLLY